jgi:hypothetical protein
MDQLLSLTVNHKGEILFLEFNYLQGELGKKRQIKPQKDNERSKKPEVRLKPIRNQSKNATVVSTRMTKD